MSDMASEGKTTKRENPLEGPIPWEQRVRMLKALDEYERLIIAATKVKS